MLCSDHHALSHSDLINRMQIVAKCGLWTHDVV